MMRIYCRQQHVFFDPTTNGFCQDGFVDISPKADGGVLKKVVIIPEKGIYSMDPMYMMTIL